MKKKKPFPKPKVKANHERAGVQPRHLVLDIELRGSSGADLLKLLKAHPHIIKRARVRVANEQTDKLSDKIDCLLNELLNQKKKPGVLTLSNKDGAQRVPYSDILFLCTTKETTAENKTGTRFLFRLLNGRGIILSNKSLDGYEAILPPCDFARASSAYIINIPHIKIFHRKSWRVIMKPYTDPDTGETKEEEIDLQPGYRHSFEKRYDDYEDQSG